MVFYTIFVQPIIIMKINHFKTFAGLLVSACTLACASANAQTASDSIRINQLGFYPKGPKTAIVLTDHAQKFTIQSGTKIVFTGTLTPSTKPDLSGRTIYVANFSNLQQPGSYTISVADAGYSYPFSISNNIHQKVAMAAIKG